MTPSALPQDPNPPDSPSASRETFPLQRILQIVRDQDAYMQARRYDMGETCAIYETRWWLWTIGMSKNTPNPLTRDGTQIEVNRLRKMVRTYAGSLYPRTSRAVCEADPHGRGDAEVTQAALNHWWKKPYAYLTVDDATIMALTLPGAGFKVGYDPGTSSPLERVWLRPIPPWELVLDRDAPSWEDERYRGHLYQAPVEEVYERYPHLRGRLNGGRRTDFFETSVEGNPPTQNAVAQVTTDTGDFVRVFEFLNLRDSYLAPSGEVYRGRLEVYILDQGEVSKAPVVVTPLPFQDADGRDLPNIEPLIFDHEIGYPFRPIAPTRSAIPQQVELNKMRTASAGDVRRNARKYAALKGAVEQDQLDLLNNGVDGQGVFVNEGHKPSDALFPIPHQPIPADTIQYTQQAERDLDRQLGPSQNAQGQFSKDNTAYEVQTIQLYAEQEIQYHMLILVGCLARVTRLAQRAIIAAGCDAGDSEGGPGNDPEVPVADPGAEPPPPGVEGEVAAKPVPRMPPKSMAKKPKIQAFQSFPIMEGDRKLTVTDKALNGDFPITFVDADNSPVNRQTVLQFMTGPGLQQYMALWTVAVKGGPEGLLAKRSMQHLAEAMHLPKDMHPDAMEATLKREEAAKAREPKGPPKGVAMAQNGPQAPPEPQPQGDGTAALTDALQNALTTLARLAQASPEAKEQLLPAGRAIAAAIEAVKAGDAEGLTAAVQGAAEALPPGVAPEVEALLAELVDKLGSEEAAPSGGPGMSAGPPGDPAGSPLVDGQTPPVGG